MRQSVKAPRQGGKASGTEEPPADCVGPAQRTEKAEQRWSCWIEWVCKRGEVLLSTKNILESP